MISNRTLIQTATQSGETSLQQRSQTANAYAKALGLKTGKTLKPC